MSRSLTIASSLLWFLTLLVCGWFSPAVCFVPPVGNTGPFLAAASERQWKWLTMKTLYPLSRWRLRNTHGRQADSLPFLPRFQAVELRLRSSGPCFVLQPAEAFLPEFVSSVAIFLLETCCCPCVWVPFVCPKTISCATESLLLAASRAFLVNLMVEKRVDRRAAGG